MGRGGQDDQFGVNRRLFSIPEIYGAEMLEAIRSGNVRREVIGQRPASGKKTKLELDAELHVFLQMRGYLNSYGYHPEGRCLELGDNVAIRYENDRGNAINIVFQAEGPMFYTYRTGIDRGRIVPSGTFGGSPDPFLQIGARGLSTFDDRTMRITGTSVELPSAMRLPENQDPKQMRMFVPEILRRRWKDAIRKSNPENPTGKLKHARLYY
jgi:hypothetical protein